MSSPQVLPNSHLPLDQTQRHEFKEQYLHHQSIAKTLAGKDLLYNSALERAEHSTKCAKRAFSRLATIRQAEKLIEKQLKLLQAKRMRKFFFPNRTHQQIRKLGAHLKALSEDRSDAKREAIKAKAKARTDANARDELKSDAKLLKEAREKRLSILESVFGGPGVGTDEENRIESKRDNLTLLVSRERDTLLKQKNVLTLLEDASELLTGAKTLLYDAKVSNSIDMFSSGSISIMASVRAQCRFKEAATAAREAGRKIESAVELNDDLAVTELTFSNESVVLTLADIFYDDIVTDMAVRVTIEKAAKFVDEVKEKLDESIQAQQSRVTDLSNSVEQCSSDLEQTSEKLVQIREKLFLKAVDE